MKHHEVTLNVKCEALKEIDKGRLNKDVENQIFEAFQNSSLKTWKSENWNIGKVKWSLVEVVYINAW